MQTTFTDGVPFHPGESGRDGTGGGGRQPGASVGETAPSPEMSKPHTCLTAVRVSALVDEQPREQAEAVLRLSSQNVGGAGWHRPLST